MTNRRTTDGWVNDGVHDDDDNNNDNDDFAPEQ